MWHIKLNNIDENSFIILKSILNDNIFCKNIKFPKHVVKEYYLKLENDLISSAPEALSIGEDEIKLLSSILNLYHYNNKITVDCPYEIDSEGTRTMHLTFVDEINIADSLNINSNNELFFSSEEEKKDNMIKMYNESKNSEVKQQLLRYINIEKNWINAYKIYEILRANFKTEKELKAMPELKTFAHSANSPKAIGDEARHAVQNKKSPKITANFKNSYLKLISLSIEFILKKSI
ncbi:MAG: hypothetical protein MJK08_03995 [Campylobacterales bacterium]|nr:hypothetical protein [Campylobacterales bacterium]